MKIFIDGEEFKRAPRLTVVGEEGEVVFDGCRRDENTLQEDLDFLEKFAKRTKIDAWDILHKFCLDLEAD